MHELAPIVDRLSRHRAKRHARRHDTPRAAVAVVLRETTQGAELLLIERAQRAGDPWSGHMGLPGGRLEDSDAGRGSQAAIRETQEEMGFVLSPADGIGRLSDIRTLGHNRRTPMMLSPFVYRWPAGEQPIVPNHEVADWLWVALAWLDEPANRGTLTYRKRGLKLDLPSYDCGGDRRLWGLTLRIIDELLRVAQQAA